LMVLASPVIGYSMTKMIMCFKVSPKTLRDTKILELRYTSQKLMLAASLRTLRLFRATVLGDLSGLMIEESSKLTYITTF
jgi:hypothetical protein